MNPFEILNYKQTEDATHININDVPDTSWIEGVKASFVRAYDENPTALIFEDIYTDKFFKEGTLMAEDEWENSPLYRRGIYWHKNMTDNEAAYLANQFDRVDKLNKTIYDSGIGFLPKLGTGLAAGILDPGNVVAGLIPFVGEARFAKLGTTAGMAARGAVQATAESIIVEPFAYRSAQELQYDYTLKDSVINVAFSAAAGGILGGGSALIKAKIGKLKQVEGFEIDDIKEIGATTKLDEEPIVEPYSSPLRDKQINDTVKIVEDRVLNGEPLHLEQLKEINEIESKLTGEYVKEREHFIDENIDILEKYDNDDLMEAILEEDLGKLRELRGWSEARNYVRALDNVINTIDELNDFKNTFDADKLWARVSEIQNEINNRKGIAEEEPTQVKDKEEIKQDMSKKAEIVKKRYFGQSAAEAQAELDMEKGVELVEDDFWKDYDNGDIESSKIKDDAVEDNIADDLYDCML